MDTQFEAINWGLGEIAFFGRAEGALADELAMTAARQTHGLFAWLEREMGDSEWFNGDAFGRGDLSVIPYVNTSASFGNLPADGTRLADWAMRANARPSVELTAQEAGDSIAGMEEFSKLVAQGGFKREYRDHRLEWMIKSGGLQVVLDGVDKQNVRFSNDFS